MYETLTSLSIAPSAKPKPTVDLSKTRKSRLSDEVRSPAVPLKAAQILGTTNLSIISANSPPPKTPRTPKSAKLALHHSHYTSVPFSENYLRPVGADAEHEPRSVAGKLALVFQSGTQQIEAAVGLGPEKAKKTKAERRREELKKKIVLVKSGKEGFL